MINPKKTLVIDTSNILFRVASVQKHTNPYATSVDPEDMIGLCMHISLQSIHKWYNKFKPDFVVFAFEGGNNWRKKYTADVKARLAYKGNRVIDPGMAHFYELIDSFKQIISSHTSVCCLAVPTMEGDDSIAAYCQLYAQEGSEIYIVSADRDFVQLLKLPGVHLVDPDKGNLRNKVGDKDYEADLDYWLFRKCVRGDMGDYVPSCFPRVRETRIKKAYENDFERLNFMNEVWKDENLVEHKVGELFEQNKILLSLFDQPEEQRKILEEGVVTQVENLNHYSHFHFLRFLSQYKLVKVQEQAIKFVDMFSNNQRWLSGETKSQKTIIKEERKEIELEEAPKNGLLQF